MRVLGFRVVVSIGWSIFNISQVKYTLPKNLKAKEELWKLKIFHHAKI
jgi:hypothetical protein